MTRPLPLLLLAMSCASPPEDRLTRIQRELTDSQMISYSDLRWLGEERGDYALAEVFSKFEKEGVPASDHWYVALILSGAVRDGRR